MCAGWFLTAVKGSHERQAVNHAPYASSLHNSQRAQLVFKPKLCEMFLDHPNIFGCMLALSNVLSQE